MENFRNTPRNRDELIADSWSILAQLVPTANTVALAATFINQKVTSSDKAEIETQVENLTIEVAEGNLPIETKEEVKTSLSNTRSYLSL